MLLPRSFHALLLLVGLAPLPFGSNRPWAWSLLALATGLLLVYWAWRVLRRSLPDPVLVPGTGPAALLFALVCGYVALQIVPGMPEGLANPYWRLPAEVLDTTAYDSISIAPDATVTALMRLLTYGAIFWLFVQHCRAPSRAERALLAFALISGAYSSYGLIAHLSGSEQILWFDKWAHFGSLTATFPNRNHFATFTGLGLLCSLACLSRSILTTGERLEQASDLLTRPEPGLFLFTALIILQLIALYLSESRGGIISAGLAAAVFSVGVVWRIRRRPGLALALGALCFGPAVLYLALAGGGFFERLATLFDPETSEARPAIYAMVSKAIAEFPWLGVGYGAFEDAFRIYREAPVADYFDKAHNIYLENATELGIPAAMALVLSVVWLAAICLRSLRRRRGEFVYGWVGVCATVLVGLHGTVDYSLQIPAVAVMYAAVLGMAVAQSSRAPSMPRQRLPIGRRADRPAPDP